MFREVRWLCQTALILLKPGRMEVRLSANQNVSVIVFRDKVYSKHPIDHGSTGMCAPSLFIMHTADCFSKDQHLLGEA